MTGINITSTKLSSLVRDKTRGTVLFWRKTRTNSLEEAVRIAVHESLHEQMPNDVANTVFSEALFDALCGRLECGLWFGAEVFSRITGFLGVCV